MQKFNVGRSLRRSRATISSLHRGTRRDIANGGSSAYPPGVNFGFKYTPQGGRYIDLTN